MGQLVIRGGRILSPGDGLDLVGDLLIEDDKVLKIGPGLAEDYVRRGWDILDATGSVVAPGLVDLHCHLREPGYEEKEDIATGSLAAAAGGFTTVCCMPNTEPAIDSRASVEYIYQRAREVGLVRVLPIGAVTKGRAGKELVEMADMVEAGAIAFSDDGSPVANSQVMRNALLYSSMLGVPIVDHCEDPELARGAVMNEGAVSNKLGLKGMPRTAEEAMVARDILLAELTGGRVHLAHISTTGSVELVRWAKARGIPVTAEVTPHHLVMTDDLVAGRWPTFPRANGRQDSSSRHLPYDTNTKVNPPLRTRRDVEALIEGLKDGTIDAIATDHAPHTVVDKQCEYDQAAMGIAGLETALGALMILVEAGALDLATIIEKLTAGPARCFGLDAGHLREGGPADIVIFDPALEWQVVPDALHSKGKNTPFLGETLRGKTVATIREGRVVYTVRAGVAVA